MMSRRARRGALVAAAALTLTGCANEIEPNGVGLRYTAGSFEGRQFHGIAEPGDVAYTVNDQVSQLPLGQRSYTIRNAEGADVVGFITVPAGGNAETGGTLVNFEVTTAFKLNTRTDDIPGFEGGTARKFYEDLCRHYTCVTAEGINEEQWRKLLFDKYYPLLEAAFKDEARKDNADLLVDNVEGALTNMQERVGETFGRYLTEQIGNEYFCGPSFDRREPGIPGHEDPKKWPCPPVELTIISADYANPKVRESREAKKVASDQADAQGNITDALKDPNYLRYLEIQACKETASCVMVVGGNGSVPVAVTPPQPQQ